MSVRDDIEIRFEEFKESIVNLNPNNRLHEDYYNAGMIVGKKLGIDMCLEYINRIREENE